MCVAFMPLHLVLFECKRFQKCVLGAAQILLRIFQNFLEFILIFLKLFLFIRRL
jgi:hypothetical protein